MLSIRGVTKKFGSLTAVDQVTLELPVGHVHAFLGPNGAGKTTTIRMCTGLLRPDSGQVLVGGFDVTTHGVEARALLAYVPDEPYLYDRLTGREFLDFTGRVYGLPRDLYEQRLAEVSAQFSLDRFLDQLADSYSHGMRQRVVLAAAMLHHPKVLIVDEPLVGLDPKHIRIVLAMLRSIADAGGCVLMSTHSLSTVEGVCDGVSVMDHGKIIASGTVESLKNGNDLESSFLALTEHEAPPTSRRT
jgi:ABC-2 type transport system ATP-binding protein